MAAPPFTTTPHVQRFLFLIDLLKKTGICTPHIRSAMTTYLRDGLASHEFKWLREKLPNLGYLSDPKWRPTLTGLALLGKDKAKNRDLPLDHVTTALADASSHIVSRPGWLIGPDDRGWLFQVARRCSGGNGTFGLADYETVLWAGIVIRALLAREQHLAATAEGSTPTFFPSDAFRCFLREALLGIFGQGATKTPGGVACKCKDADRVYTVSRRKGLELVEFDDAEQHAVVAARIENITGNYGVDGWFERPLQVREGYVSSEQDRPLRLAAFRARWNNAEFRSLLAMLPDAGGGPLLELRLEGDEAEEMSGVEEVRGTSVPGFGGDQAGSGPKRSRRRRGKAFVSSPSGTASSDSTLVETVTVSSTSSVADSCGAWSVVSSGRGGRSGW